MWLWLSLASVAPAGPSDVPQEAILRPPSEDEEAPLDEAELLEAVKQLDPLQYERLLRLKLRDSVGFQAALRRTERRAARAARDPEALARSTESRGLIQELLGLRDRYRVVSGDERVAIRAQMVGKALTLMELKQAERRARLSEMQAKLDKVQAEVDQREANKDRLVDEYVDALLER